MKSDDEMNLGFVCDTKRMKEPGPLYLSFCSEIVKGEIAITLDGDAMGITVEPLEWSDAPMDARREALEMVYEKFAELVIRLTGGSVGTDGAVH